MSHSGHRKAPSRRKKVKRQKRKEDQTLLMASCGEIAANLGIHEWDFLLIGDGAGAGWKIGCGWASIIVDRLARKRHWITGGLSTGTIRLAELLPYLHSLMWIEAHRGKILRESLDRPIAVHIISDNEATVISGNTLAKRTAGAANVIRHYPLWAAVQQYDRLGYELRYHWMRRDKLALNMVADALSVAARKANQSIELPKRDDGSPIDLDNLNRL
jgi:hypothetical protein